MNKIQISLTDEQLSLLNVLSELTKLSRARIVRDILDKNEAELRDVIERMEKNEGYLM